VQEGVAPADQGGGQYKTLNFRLPFMQTSFNNCLPKQISFLPGFRNFFKPVSSFEWKEKGYDTL